MKQILVGLTKMLSVFVITFIAISLRTGVAHASPAYNSSNLIGDGVFTNYHSMTSSDIQNFLSSEGSGLARYSDLEDCGPTNGSHYSYYQQFYHCSSTVSAAQIIYDAAQAYQINPQAIMATLQKEEGLITDPNPTQSTLNVAMGYGCPSTCNPAYSGFFLQVDNATWQFRYDFEGAQRVSSWNGWSSIDTGYANLCGDNSPLTNYSTGLYPGRTVTFYDSGGTPETITIANASTATLYCYTPFVGPYSLTGYSGSYNFVVSFESWFGSVTGLAYSWWVDSFSFNPTMGVGTSQTVTLKATNTGNNPWYANNADPVHPTRLKTWPAGSSSPFQSGAWLNPTTPAEMAENVVWPGDDGTFTFQITAPGTPGTYVQPFNLVMENYQWFPWAGFSPTITVTPQYTWQIQNVIYGNSTGNMGAGSQQLITLIAKNIGAATWYKTACGGNSGQTDVRLGTWQPQRQSAVAWNWISSTRATEMNDCSVPPGSTTGFQFYVNMPSSGNYYERMNLVAEGVSWFNDPGLTLYLHGQTYAWQPLYYTISTGTAAMPRGSNFTVTLKAKNTGEATWTQGGLWPVRVGTWPPQSTSALYSTGGSNPWISNLRPAGLQESSVVPCSTDPNNCTGTFIFDAKMPPNPGESNQYFNLVAEGLTWFNNPGFYIYLHSL